MMMHVPWNKFSCSHELKTWLLNRFREHQDTAIHSACSAVRGACSNSKRGEEQEVAFRVMGE